MTHEGPLYEAAAKMMEAGLRRSDSLFTPGFPVWTEKAAEDLKERFVDAPDTGQDSFMVKFKKQLAGAPRPTVQLAAELLYVYLLPPVASNIGLEKKRSLLRETLSWSREPVAVPQELDLALEDGFASVGAAYNNQRDRQISYLVRFLLEFRQVSAERQQAAVRDPRLFRELAYHIAIHAAQSMRNALLHLAFPDFFQDTVSDTQKEQIRAAFNELVSDQSADVDQALFEIRQALERERGGRSASTTLRCEPSGIRSGHLPPLQEVAPLRGPSLPSTCRRLAHSLHKSC